MAGRKKNMKACCICGRPFPDPPSGTRTTCSPECSKLRRKEYAHGHRWSLTAKERRRADPDVQARVSAIQAVGAAASMRLPESQRGPQHRTAKVWIMQAPDGTLHKAVNLLAWARQHTDLFEPGVDPEQAAQRIRSGISAVARSMAGTRRGRPVYSYKGWRVLSSEDKTPSEQAAALAAHKANKNK